MPVSRFTESQEREIAEESLTSTQLEISKKYGISRALVDKWKRKYFPHSLTPKTCHSKKQQMKILEEYLIYKDLKHICWKYKISRSTLALWREKYAPDTIKKIRKWSVEEKDRIVKESYAFGRKFVCEKYDIQNGMLTIWRQKIKVKI